MSLSNAILRGVTGAFVLNSGLSKRGMPTEDAKGLQGFAATGIPAVADMDPKTFSDFVAYSEIGIGAALLTPFVPRKLAGAALGVFSAGLLSMYFRNPAMTESDGIRPSQEGMSLAKDSFMLAIAGALLTDK